MEAEEEIHRTRSSNANQETQQKKVDSSGRGSSDERVRGDSGGEKNDQVKNRDCSIDIKVDAVNGTVPGGSETSSKAERVCRICHLGAESSSEGSELLELGCDCRGELGWSHRHCADAWFWHKGDRRCEICGTMAKNVDNKSREETSLFLMEWNEIRLVAATLDNPQASSRRCKQYICRFLAICLVLAFLLPWFFKGIHLL
ncbi:hypothetical protein F511_07969 [Dorcoceras hygrometricum]|uniref:RING-CH-type domain-containing protein n=1 Tax=Dorcoceras hygrometricum TaxID=472368 RepID=A0A2Z7C8C8_9LAMI|nr:hypothetical protein F511_07969 [Dorcoceras hygrometricum]